ncbi:MAG: hypothetical protein IJZ36_00710 [Bacilli bacterium]|nr:hypothetical protein [Bacilli bacterium]
MKYKHFLKFNKSALKEGLAPERILYVNGYDSTNDVIIATNSVGKNVEFKGNDLLDKIVRYFDYSIQNPELLKGTTLLDDYRFDRKITVNNLSVHHSTYNDRYNNAEEIPPIVEDTLCIITVESWRPRDNSGYVELFAEDLFAVFLEKNQDADATFEYVWSVIKNNVKNSWVVVLSTEEKKWLK